MPKIAMEQGNQQFNHYKEYIINTGENTAQILPRKSKNFKMGSISIKFRCSSDGIRKDGTAPIMLQTFILGQQVRVNTGIKIDPAQFDAHSQKIKGRTDQANDWNRVLEGIRAKANSIDVEYRLRNAVLTPQAFKDEMTDTSSRLNFIKFMKYQMEEQRTGGDIAESTYKQHQSSFKRWTNFKSEVFFAEINFSMLQEFERFMRTKMRLKPESIETTMKNTKKYMTIARNKGISFEWPFDLYKISRSKSKIEYLTKAERSKIFEYYQSSFCKENHRAMLAPFLFAAHFGGVRYGDWSQLKKANISEGKLSFTPEKTKKFNIKVNIPISDFANHFINQDPDEPALFKWVPSQPYCNRMLKEVALICNINKTVSTHIARHTFGSLFYQATKNLLACSKLMGHRSITQTMDYAHLDDQVLEDEMQAFQQWSKL